MWLNKAEWVGYQLIPRYTSNYCMHIPCILFCHANNLTYLCTWNITLIQCYFQFLKVLGLQNVCASSKLTSDQSWHGMQYTWSGHIKCGSISWATASSPTLPPPPFSQKKLRYLQQKPSYIMFVCKIFFANSFVGRNNPSNCLFIILT